MAAKRPDLTDDDYIKAYKENDFTFRRAAAALGVHPSAVSQRLLSIKSKGGYDYEIDRTPEAYKSRSTLYGPSGEVKLTWVKDTADDERRSVAMKLAAEALAADLPRYKPVPLPKKVADHLCTLYTMTDCHVGMLAWHRETGADWDLDIAERVLTGCFMQMVYAAPPAKVGILNQLGDFLHFDGLQAITPTSGHVLDADSRFQKIVEVAVRILRRLIDAMLEKHEQVHVYMHEGNHDMAASVWLRVFFAALYEKEPRVTVDVSPSPYVAHQHGSTMIGFHHGHLAKNSSLPLLFAAKFPAIWGSTTKRYIHVGHRHHVDEKEHPGVKLFQHPTLAAPDAYAARGGWISERQTTAITYHDQFGEFARNVIVPEMVE